MKCPRCKTEYKKGQKFCKKCGYDLQGMKKKALTAVLCAVVILLTLFVIGKVSVKRISASPIQIIYNFEKAIRQEDFEKAFSLTSHEESRFINPESLKNYFKDHKGYDIKEDGEKEGEDSLKIDLSEVIIDFKIYLPKGSTLIFDSVEIKETEPVSGTTDLAFLVGPVFAGHHKIKITSPLCDDYSDNIEITPKEMDEINGWTVLDLKKSTKSEIEKTASQFFSDFVNSASNAADFESLKISDKDNKISPKYDELKENFKKNKIENVKITYLGTGDPIIIENSMAGITVFMDIDSGNKKNLLISATLRFILNDDQWEIESMEFVDLPK